jgi:hypothetical protein
MSSKGETSRHTTHTARSPSPTTSVERTFSTCSPTRWSGEFDELARDFLEALEAVTVLRSGTGCA